MVGESRRHLYLPARLWLVLPTQPSSLSTGALSANFRLIDIPRGAQGVIPPHQRQEHSCVRRSGSVFLAIFDGLDLDCYRVHHINDRLHLEFEGRKDARDIMDV
jgi:hypothetical protein